MKQVLVNKLQNFFTMQPVEKAWIFGSYSRGEETRKSDIDILVRFNDDAHISLFDYVRIIHSLEDVLHKKVDLVEDGQLKNFAKNSAEKDKILVYERKN
ncbi:hypothetical protein AGMMS49525_18260 [Bacteroidia bacterium]|nr:hypothetical protein AGMMS49525_18260 [Bacteroidia bacterium]